MNAFVKGNPIVLASQPDTVKASGLRSPVWSLQSELQRQGVGVRNIATIGT
jgi:hypothetical protein